jgi:hypothetical protein
MLLNAISFADHSTAELSKVYGYLRKSVLVPAISEIGFLTFVADYVMMFASKMISNRCGHQDRKHFAKGMCAKCYRHAWIQKPEIKARRVAYSSDPAVKARDAARKAIRRTDPEFRAKQNATQATWRARPENRAKQNVYNAARYASPAFRARQAAYGARPRLAAIEFLGGKCARCGFGDLRALQIDHVNGGGNIERKSIGLKKTYERAVTGASGYQLLCANCNMIKRIENREFRRGQARRIGP